MKKAFSFSEFNPASYTNEVDWRTIALRWVVIASIIIVPVSLTLLQFLYKQAPFVVYMIGGIAALYLPALFLIRSPSVEISKDFKIQVNALKTVNTKILLHSACSAAAYFLLLIVGIVVMGGR